MLRFYFSSPRLGLARLIRRLSTAARYSLSVYSLASVNPDDLYRVVRVSVYNSVLYCKSNDQNLGLAKHTIYILHLVPVGVLGGVLGHDAVLEVLLVRPGPGHAARQGR